jgi:hypothetical protein
LKLVLVSLKLKYATFVQPVIQDLRYKHVAPYESHLKKEFAWKKETSAIYNMQENSIEMQLENLVFPIFSSFFHI